MSHILTIRRTAATLAAATVLLGALAVPAQGVSAAAAISLSRDTAAPGDTVVVTGSGFHAGDAAGVTAYLAVYGHARQTQVVMSINGAGGFRTALTLPVGTNPGTYRITARDYHGTTATRYLTVWPLVTVRPGTNPTVDVIEGRRYYVSGTGFGANETVHLSASYTLYNGDVVTVSTNKQTNGNGRFYEAVMHVPWDAAARTDTLTATGSTSSRKASANLRVTYRPSVSASPGRVNPGATITVRGFGYVPNTHVNVSMTFPRTDGSTLTLSKSPFTDQYGNFSTSLSLPGNIANGAHTINAVDATGGFRAATRIVVTPRPQPTATATPQPSATPTPTATPKPLPKKHGIGFDWVSLWFHPVRHGTWDHLGVQVKPHKAMGIWVTIIFPNGQRIRFFNNTNSHGYWTRNFNIPRNAISKYSNQGDITIQLWSGKKTVKYFITFTIV
jgi:hypothetical protein